MTGPRIEGAEELVDYIETVRGDAAGIAASLRTHGGAAHIAACRGWSVRDVVRHLGDVHRWATAIVATRNEAEEIESGASSTDDELAEWLIDGAERLVATLAATDPSAPCWTFGSAPGVTGFWRRRQALETAVHRFDVEDAIGRAAGVPPALATTGITEVVDFLYPRQVGLGRTAPLEQGVRLVATDFAGEWSLGRRPAVAEVSGPAPALLLMLWDRPHGAVHREGALDALAAFDAAALVP